MILIVVLIVNVGSSLGVVYVRHESRLLSVQLGTLEKEQDNAVAEWSRLQFSSSRMPIVRSVV